MITITVDAEAQIVKTEFDPLVHKTWDNVLGLLDAAARPLEMKLSRGYTSIGLNFFTHYQIAIAESKPTTNCEIAIDDALSHLNAATRWAEFELRMMRTLDFQRRLTQAQIAQAQPKGKLHL